MDLSIGMAMSAVAGVSLFITPTVVLLGWMAGLGMSGSKSMTLYFESFQAAILFASMLIVNHFISEGRGEIELVSLHPGFESHDERT